MNSKQKTFKMMFIHSLNSETPLEASSRYPLVILGTMENESQKPPSKVLNISSSLTARQDAGNITQNLLADLNIERSGFEH